MQKHKLLLTRFSFSSKSNFLSDLLKYIIIFQKPLILSLTKTLYFGKLDFTVFFSGLESKKSKKNKTQM